MRYCSELLFSASLKCVSSSNGREPTKWKKNKQQSAEIIATALAQLGVRESGWEDEYGTMLPGKMEVAFQTQPEENKHSIHSK